MSMRRNPKIISVLLSSCVVAVMSLASTTPTPTISTTDTAALTQVENMFFDKKAFSYQFDLSLSFTLPSSTTASSISKTAVYRMFVSNRTVTVSSLLLGEPVGSEVLYYSTTTSSENELDIRTCLLTSLTIEQMLVRIGSRDYDPQEKVSYDFTLGLPLSVVFLCGNLANPISVSTAVSNFTIVAKDLARVALQERHDTNLQLWRALGWKEYHFTLHKSCQPFCPDGLAELLYIINVDHDRITLIYDVLNQEEVPTGRAAIYTYFSSMETFFLEADKAIDWAELSTIQLEYAPNQGYITHLSYRSATTDLSAVTYDQDFVKISDAEHTLYVAPQSSDPTVALVVSAIVVALLVVVGFAVYRYNLRSKWGNFKKAKQSGSPYQEAGQSVETADVEDSEQGVRPSVGAGKQNTLNGAQKGHSRVVDIDYGDEEIHGAGREMQRIRINQSPRCPDV